MSTISPPRHFLCGAGKRSRTSDLRITNALLYQLSYTGTQEMRLYRKRLFCAIRCRREVYSENSRKLTSEVVAHMKPSWKERLGLENASRLRTLHQYSKNVLGYLTWPAAREAAPGVNLSPYKTLVEPQKEKQCRNPRPFYSRTGDSNACDLKLGRFRN